MSFIVIFRSIALITILTTSVVTFSQTTTSSQSCGVSGRVVRASDGLSLKNVRLQLTPAGPTKDPQIYRGTTDGDGRFAFKEVKAGSYRFLARKAGFVTQAYLAKGPYSEGVILTLAPGQEIKDTLFRMITAAAAIGRIMDEEGEPIAGVEVQALVKGEIDDSDMGFFRSQTTIVPIKTAVTNDLGEFRLYGLAPGRYYFSAINSGNPDYTETQHGFSLADTESGSKYPPVYYPGVFEQSQATQVLLRAGDETRLDFRLQPQRTATVSGRVINTTSQPAAGVTVRLQPRELHALFSGLIFNAPTSVDGRFAIKNVPPGSYLITAQLISGDQQETSQEELEVGGDDINSLELALRKPISIKGKITASTGTPLKQPTVIYFSPLHGLIDDGFAQVKDDGTFVSQNLHPGTFALRANLPEGWYIESARLDNEDVFKAGLNITPDAANSSLEITVSQASAQLEGAVYDGEEAAQGALVHLKPTVPSQFRFDLMQRTVTDQNGHFVFRTVPPGKYEVAAEEDTGEASDSPKADLQKDAKKIELGKGEHKRIRLQIVAQ